ncbi:MAG: ABC transporter ATP-binding protein [Clostridiales bacterium]|nr:ABC transporter ATP-binding protein [Candidatus Blautia equi]
MITVKNLVKNYEDFNLEISMEIPSGTVTGLIGKNGAGKSTTIKSILGLIKPDGGEVKVFGTEASKMKAGDKEALGVALSDACFSGELAVDDIAKILKKMYRAFDADAFLKKCKQMKLPKDKSIKAFSTGMKAKLRVLIAMSHKAKLLILDEPTAGLDVEARMDILDMLRDYISEDEERSILITSHISSDLEGICDDIYMIHDGRVILHEDTDTILAQYALLKVDEHQMEKLDQQYILKTKKEAFGYTCLTNQKQYYMENYPDVVIENGRIDDLILMLTGGKR